MNEKTSRFSFTVKEAPTHTGAIIAVYRVEHDGWTSEQAKAEAKRYGLGFWQVKIKDYISDYSKHRKRMRADHWILVPGLGSKRNQ